MSYVLRIDRDNKTIKDLAGDNSRTQTTIEKLVKTIRKMHSHNIFEEKYFSYFEMYIPMISEDDTKTYNLALVLIKKILKNLKHNW